MPKDRSVLRILEKKINCAFFVDEAKTRHFKLNYVLFLFLCIFFLLAFLISAIFAIYSVKLWKDKNELSQSVLNLKKFYMHNYFEARFSTEAQDETGDDLGKQMQPPISQNITQEASKQAPAPLSESFTAKDLTMPLPSKLVDAVAKAAVGGGSVNEGKTQDIKIDKEAVSSQGNTVVLSFWLVNALKNKDKALAGAVCLVLKGQNQAGEKLVLTYPEGLLKGNEAQPTSESCILGEHVKFIRLRPSVFEFNTQGQNFTAKTADVYFMDKSGSNVRLLKTLRFE